jgi:hypothetical protein
VRCPARHAGASWFRRLTRSMPRSSCFDGNAQWLETAVRLPHRACDEGAPNTGARGLVSAFGAPELQHRDRCGAPHSSAPSRPRFTPQSVPSARRLPSEVAFALPHRCFRPTGGCILHHSMGCAAARTE